MSGDEDPERGFTIVDRRSDADDEAKADPTPPQTEAAATDPTAGPPVDFTGFVLSLGTSALYHLGLVADPETGAPGEPNLPIARQTIDTLVMLQQKTSGNLDDDEQALLANLLTELRMRFVEMSGGS